MGRHERRAELSKFKRKSRAGLTSYLLASDDALLDREPLLRNAVQWWRANAATRRPICICCKSHFTGEAYVDVAAFLLATSSSSPGNASVSGICTECWKLPDDEIERAALRVLRTFLPDGKFEDAT